MVYDSIKTIIIGDSSVGKSCILYRFINNKYNPYICSTISVEHKIITIDYEQKKVKLAIWDIDGKGKFTNILKTFNKDLQVVILVFDLTNKESFNNIDLWIDRIKNEDINNYIFIVVGNKSDLKKKIKITNEEIIKKIINLQLDGYFECSAKNNDSIQEIFFSVIKLYSDMKNIIDYPLYNENIKKSYNIKKNKCFLGCIRNLF